MLLLANGYKLIIGNKKFTENYLYGEKAKFTFSCIFS